MLQGDGLDVPHAENGHERQHVHRVRRLTTNKPANYAQLYARTFNEIREMTLVNRDRREGPSSRRGADLLAAPAARRPVGRQQEPAAFQRQGAPCSNTMSPDCEDRPVLVVALISDQTRSRQPGESAGNPVRPEGAVDNVSSKASRCSLSHGSIRCPHGAIRLPHGAALA
jgi:hypothetical protein